MAATASRREAGCLPYDTPVILLEQSGGFREYRKRDLFFSFSFLKFFGVQNLFFKKGFAKVPLLFQKSVKRKKRSSASL